MCENVAQKAGRHAKDRKRKYSRETKIEEPDNSSENC